jgi:hypothetical protein
MDAGACASGVGPSRTDDSLSSGIDDLPLALARMLRLLSQDDDDPDEDRRRRPDLLP